MRIVFRFTAAVRAQRGEAPGGAWGAAQGGPEDAVLGVGQAGAEERWAVSPGSAKTRRNR